jgi:hypothetical protein
MRAAVVNEHSSLTYSWLMKDHVRFFTYGGTSPGEASGVSGRLVDQRPGCPGIRRSHRAPGSGSARRRCRGGGLVRLLAGRADGGYGGLLGFSGDGSARARPGRSNAARPPPRGDASGGRHRRSLLARSAEVRPGDFSRQGGRGRAAAARLGVLGLTRGVPRGPHRGRPAPVLERFRRSTSVCSRRLGRALGLHGLGRSRPTSKGKSRLT